MKNHTNVIASLKTTNIDTRLLNVSKSLKVNNKDVATSVKHPNDTREVITENDLWGSWAEIKDGEIIFHDDEVTNPNIDGPVAWNTSITKVEENKAYIDDILYANVQTEKLNEADDMFAQCSNLTVFTSDLSSLISGRGMFSNCSNLSSFDSDLSSLTNGTSMFRRCSNLTTFTLDLSSLTNGASMFECCFSLDTFTSDLSSLINGYCMFISCFELTTFDSNLSSLTHGFQMFYNCPNLTVFTSDLSSLTYGFQMFQYCPTFTTFASDLSSLTNGYLMFDNCKLNTDSLIHIAETINDVRDLTNSSSSPSEQIYKTIHIGIGNTTPTEEETELLTEIHNKGWQVYVNGSSTDYAPSTTLIPIDGEETITPIPYWAKPQETDEEHAEYIGEDGKYYIILGGNYIFVDDKETYGLFTSLEDAAANMRLTKIEKTTNKN